ncbi:hypothetical protein D3C76_1393370 [compost metagenome]
MVFSKNMNIFMMNLMISTYVQIVKNLNILLRIKMGTSNINPILLIALIVLAFYSVLIVRINRKS